LRTVDFEQGYTKTYKCKIKTKKILIFTKQTSKIKKNGILNGIFVGTIYIIMLYLISSIISKNFYFNNYSIIMIATSIAIGGLGWNNRSEQKIILAKTIDNC